MRRYYRLKDEDGWKKELDSSVMDAKRKANLESLAVAPKQSESSEDEESDGLDAEAAHRWARMRGLAGPETSDEDDDAEDKSPGNNGEEQKESSTSDDDDDELVESDEQDNDEDLQAAEREWGVGALAANPEEPIPLLPDPTSRLACVDLDWDHVRAVDIMVALRSFVPKGGAIKRVAVYPSDYGLERMAKEAMQGPQGIWRNTDRRKSNDEDSEDESEDDDAADGEVHPARLRLYERSKLRWYYAVVECDSAETANMLYEECDGLELMKSECFNPIMHDCCGALQYCQPCSCVLYVLQLHANLICVSFQMTNHFPGVEYGTLPATSPLIMILQCSKPRRCSIQMWS